MYSKLYNALASARMAVEDIRIDPLTTVRKLERGDADSSGSTLRTIGIVILVVAILGVLTVAVLAAANRAGNSINAYNGS